jgi:hypothetical protein
MSRKFGALAARLGAVLPFAALLVVLAYQLAPGSDPAVAIEQRQPLPPSAKPASAVPVPASSDGSFVVKRVLDIKLPFRHGDYVWDDQGVPAGPIVITIDLAAQTLSVFRAGYEIGAAVILYGANDKPTPLGVFPILEKDADHISNIYDAPMPYMLRLTNDGVAIHGSDVKWGAATHGCIGVPTEFAARLFAQVKPGDRVLISEGQLLRVGQALPAS